MSETVATKPVLPEHSVSVQAEIWQALRHELTRKGLSDVLETEPRPLVATQLRRDPYDGTDAVYGEWRDPNGRLLGNLILHADGKVFAELDVMRPHPTDTRWFVEGVTAWGNPGALKAELKLLPALGA